MSVARNSLLLLTTQMLGIVAGIVTSIMTARYLGTHGRGELVIINMSVALIALLAGIGLNQSFMFMIGKQRLSPAQGLGLLAVVSIVLGSISLGLSLVAFAWLQGNVLNGVEASAYLAGVAALPAYLFNELWQYLRMARNQMKAVTAYQAASLTTGLIITVVVLVWGPRDVTHLLAYLTVASWIYAVGLFVISAVQDGVSFRTPLSRLRELFGYGLRVYAGSLVNTVYLRLDSFILNAFGGTSQVGVYSIAVTLNERLWSLDGAVNQATTPHVISQNREESARIAALTSRSLLLVAGSLAIALAVVSPILVPVLYGKAFIGAVAPLLLLLPGTVLYSATRPFNSFVAGQVGKPGVVSAVGAISAIASIAVYLLLIPPLHAAGAALGSTVVYAGAFAASAIIYSRQSGVGLWDALHPRRSDFAIYKATSTRMLGSLRAVFSRSR